VKAFERRLAAVLLAPDPAAALAAAARDRALPPALRRAFAQANPDGVRIAALLVARLRFERLLRACPEAEAAFDADPARFTKVFRRYHHAVAPTAFFPAAEAALFRAWISRRAARGNDVRRAATAGRAGAPVTRRSGRRPSGRAQ
jgi:hypothetical protein